MMAPLIAFSLVGLVIFYVQHLVFFPHVHLRLLALLLFYVSLRPSLSLALGLSVVLGLLQDSYTTTPLGLHLGAALVLVAVARLCRRGLLLRQLGFQVLVSLLALLVQEVCLASRHVHPGLPALFLPELDQGAPDGNPGHRGSGTLDVSLGAGGGELSAPPGLAAPQ